MKAASVDIVEDYLDYVRETESPYIFHRWCALTSIGALLGRNTYLQFGHFRVFPNLYTMLIGNAGTRKSTAIKLARKTIASAGYESFSANKTSKEKFLLDLEGVVTDEAGSLGGGGSGGPTKLNGAATYDSVMSQSLWGDPDALREPKEVFIVADEFNEFAGRGADEFYSTLGDLWDWDDDKRPYAFRLKNSRSVSIYQPTISLLGGNTPEGFSKAFPPEILTTGFMSRMILVHGEKSGRKYTIPPVPPEDRGAALVSALQATRTTYRGAIQLSDRAYEMLDSIYRGWQEIDDVRFKAYSNRRLTQLIKLSIIFAASAGVREIGTEEIIRGNTTLAAAEAIMPKALGEFGKGKNSDVANKIMDVLGTANRPLTAKDLWAHIHQDLEKITALGDIMQGLLQAEKVQLVKGTSGGWLPSVKVTKKQEFVDWSLLTSEERGGLE